MKPLGISSNLVITLDDRNEKTDLAAIEALEKMIGFTLPEDYRDFLLQHNGGRIVEGGLIFDIWFGNFSTAGKVVDQSGVIEFLNLSQGDYSIYSDLRSRSDCYPSGTLPIATDAGGNSILLYLQEPYYGYVFFWYHDGWPGWLDIADEELPEVPEDSPDYPFLPQDSLDYLFLISKSFTEFVETLKSE